MFRGREQSRPELGYRLLQRLGNDVADYGFVETSAKQDGRNMTMVLAPPAQGREDPPEGAREPRTFRRPEERAGRELSRSAGRGCMPPRPGRDHEK